MAQLTSPVGTQNILHGTKMKRSVLVSVVFAFQMLQKPKNLTVSVSLRV